MKPVSTSLSKVKAFMHVHLATIGQHFDGHILIVGFILHSFLVLSAQHTQGNMLHADVRAIRLIKNKMHPLLKKLELCLCVKKWIILPLTKTCLYVSNFEE